jgi:hypothetical protein
MKRQVSQSPYSKVAPNLYNIYKTENASIIRKLYLIYTTLIRLDGKRVYTPRYLQKGEGAVMFVPLEGDREVASNGFGPGSVFAPARRARS